MFILPNDGVNRPESQFQEIFDNSSELLNESVKNIINGPPVIKEIAPIEMSFSHKPMYIFDTSHPGSISLSGGCSTQTKTAKSGINYIFLDHLDFGTYESCKLKLETEKSKQTEIDITKFTIQKKDYKIRPEILSLNLEKMEDNTTFNRSPKVISILQNLVEL